MLKLGENGGKSVSGLVGENVGRVSCFLAGLLVLVDWQLLPTGKYIQQILRVRAHLSKVVSNIVFAGQPLELNIIAC